MGPIFVGGASRSGKTLMRWMLSSHSRIAVSRRTEMWPRFYARFGDLASPENLDRCLGAMLARPQIASLVTDPDRLRRDFAEGEPTYGRLFALVHEQYAARCRKPRWGDQTGLIERFADALMLAYPDARIIHMVRDPRDRHEAVVGTRRAHRAGALGRSTGSWLLSAGLARRNAARSPGAYRIVRYENLVDQPEETLRALCAFLGEAFEPAMLRLDGVRRYDRERAEAADGTPISTAHVGRYRERMSRPDLAFIQAVAGGEMVRQGYPPDPVRLTGGDFVRFVARWPLNRARMVSAPTARGELVGAA